MSNEPAVSLPFLIVHGALVWKVALVILTVAPAFAHKRNLRQSRR
jgi:hypothetical protein